jgi:hypothetical protein
MITHRYASDGSSLPDESWIIVRALDAHFQVSRVPVLESEMVHASARRLWVVRRGCCAKRAVTRGRGRLVVATW